MPSARTEGYIYVRAGIPPGRGERDISPSSRPRSTVCSGKTFSAQALTSQSRCIRAPAPSSAANRGPHDVAGRPSGRAQAKYIRTAVKGRLGPTKLLNNVETWANVPLIINKGADGLPIRDREEQGNQDLLPGGQGKQHRPGRSAHGDDPAGHRLQHRRRDSQGAKSSRPCRPAAPPEDASPRSCWICPSISISSPRPVR